MSDKFWIEGKTRSGKTTSLVDRFNVWLNTKVEQSQSKARSIPNQLSLAMLVFAANGDNRRRLAEMLAANNASYPIVCKTPLGFITDEVKLFWPLIFERLELKAQFPLRLRPETEQELATQLWAKEADWQDLTQLEGEYAFVRRTLDLLQLAGASGIDPEDIPIILDQGIEAIAPENSASALNLHQRQGDLLIKWRKWCLERGLLSYGIIYELYWQYLLPDTKYRQYLLDRYRGVLADDVDDYPAIAYDLFSFFLDQDRLSIFTFNPDGQVRWGLNADPQYLSELAARCEIIYLDQPHNNLASDLSTTITQLVEDPSVYSSLPPQIGSIQTISRAELLRQTAETIVRAVNSERVKPEEIAIIAPGLDEIARYSLIEMLKAQAIPIMPLNEQRPLIGSPLVRSLLTLLALIYPGLGRLINPDAVAEMLIVCSRRTEDNQLVPHIDPVRAGLIADHCYRSDPNHPQLLSGDRFQRWDRLGSRATATYEQIRAWIEKTKTLSNKPLLAVLDLAIQELIDRYQNLSYEELAALRELGETAQHYWEVDRRIRQSKLNYRTYTDTIAQFISLLRCGTITANPRPMQYLGVKPGAVTLATIFQYRSLRYSHRWQFWLDAGSHLWAKGGAAQLYGAPLFLRGWSGRVWSAEDQYELDRQRLGRILRDLLGRATERVILCHSDLSVNGTEQAGPLFTLVQAAQQLSEDTLEVSS